MARQTSVQITEATDRQQQALQEKGFGTFTDIVRLAIDRMYRDEIAKAPNAGDSKTDTNKPNKACNL